MNTGNVRRSIHDAVLISLVLTSACVIMTIPAHAASFWETGRRAYDQDKLEEAGRIYNQAQLEKPDSPELHFNQGAVLYKQGKYEEARALFEKALQSEDKRVKAAAWYNMGNSHARLQNFPESLEAYKNSLAQNPDNPDAQYNLEWVQQKLEEQKKQQEQKNKTTTESDSKSDKQKPEESGQQQEQDSTQKNEPNKGESEKQSPDQKNSSDQPGRSSQKDSDQPKPNSDDRQSQEEQGRQKETGADSQPEGTTSDGKEAATQPAAESKNVPLSEEEVERLLRRVEDESQKKYNYLHKRGLEKPFKGSKDW